LSKLDDVIQQLEVGKSFKRNRATIFLVFLGLMFGSMYILFHYLTVSDVVVVILNIAGMTIVPLLYYVLCVRPSNGKIEFVYILFVAAVGATYLVTPSEQKDFLQALLRWLVPIVEFVIVLYVIYRIYSIVKSYKLMRSNKADQPMEIMREVLRPLLGRGVLLDIVITELSVVYYAVVIWFRKPVLPVHGSFTYHKQSQIKPIVIVFIAIIMLETVGLHFLLSIWSDVVAWITTAINGYAIVYLIAFKNSFRFLPILLDDNRLQIRLGLQCDINIPLHSIESIETAKEFGIGDKVPKDVYMAYLRFDTPQYQIRLKEPVEVKGSFGISKSYSVIIFRVDEMQPFISQLNLQIGIGS